LADSSADIASNKFCQHLSRRPCLIDSDRHPDVRAFSLPSAGLHSSAVRASDIAPNSVAESTGAIAPNSVADSGADSTSKSAPIIVANLCPDVLAHTTHDRHSDVSAMIYSTGDANIHTGTPAESIPLVPTFVPTSTLTLMPTRAPSSPPSSVPTSMPTTVPTSWLLPHMWMPDRTAPWRRSLALSLRLLPRFVKPRVQDSDSSTWPCSRLPVSLLTCTYFGQRVPRDACVLLPVASARSLVIASRGWHSCP
jgi:hypothetical protein